MGVSFLILLLQLHQMFLRIDIMMQIMMIFLKCSIGMRIVLMKMANQSKMMKTMICAVIAKPTRRHGIVVTTNVGSVVIRVIVRDMAGNES